ncbi:MFS transporter [Patescibacteria group bacterium]
MKIGKNYFDGDLSHGFVSLYTSKSIMRIASGFFGLFLPIFLYELFDRNFQYVIYYFLPINIFYFIFLALSAKTMNKFGFKKALQVSVFMGAAFYFSLYFADKDNWYWILPLSILASGMFRLTHWIPYHVDFAKFTDSKNRGREVGLLDATTNIIGVIAPLVAGLILAYFDFKMLFIIAVVVYLMAFIPLITIPRTHERFSWTYKQTWKEFLSKKRRGTIFAYMADGFECAIGAVVWPIFIFELLSGNYMAVGSVAAFITGSIIVVQLIVGKYADKKFSKGSFIRWGSVLYSLGWFLKIFIVTSFQIFIVDAYHKMMRIFLRIPFDALTYEIAADQGHFVDEFTVIHEMAVSAGRIISYIVIGVVATFVGLHWSFIFAAVASLLFNMLRAKRVVRPEVM